MGLESATYISGLNASNPVTSDQKTEGDDHIRLLKSTLLATFPNVTGAVTPTHTQLNSYGSVILKSSTGETAAAADIGKCYVTTGNITVPNSTFSGGNYFYVYTNQDSSVTVIQGSGVTLRFGGTTSTGTRTLAGRGLCQVLFLGASEAIVTGTGLS